MFLGSVLHGLLWIRDRLRYNRPILRGPRETSGLVSLGVLLIIVISSLKPVRMISYEVFRAIQYIS